MRTLCPQGLLGARGLLALRFLALALHAGLLIVLASASLGEDAALLDLLIEASQGTLEGLVFAYADFSQSGITSHRHVAALHHASAPGSDVGCARLMQLAAEASSAARARAGAV